MSDDPNAKRFPSPFDPEERPLITLVELRMRRFSGKIRSKPSWWTKVHDQDIVSKWRTEMVEYDRSMVETHWGGEKRLKWERGKFWPRDCITDAQLDYIFEELKHEAKKYDENTGIFATAIPKVFETRSLISPDLKSALMGGVAVLESVPEEEKDWHPGSNNQVLDLVHPSMYCLRIGRSYVQQEPEDGADALRVITEKAYLKQRPDLRPWMESDMRYIVSDKYQWLPTDFAVSDAGEAKALAYINNLHPIRHRSLYPVISSIFSRFVPLFEQVLSAALNSDPPPVIEVDPYHWYDHAHHLQPVYDFKSKGWNPQDPDQQKYHEVYEEWSIQHEWPQIPDPPPFTPRDKANPVSFSLRGRTVQVIVKLANIHLSPENPSYPGGSWHVEGMANEAIVATGLYYYACENITESRLDFRAAIGASDGGVDLPYQQSDDKGYTVAFGIGGNDPLNQELGHIVAEEDKCIAFPNIYQHHVDAFELADKTKPGYRKILCFFLVDPTVRILSTSDVPPQQKEWAMDEVARVPDLGKLPQELWDVVMGYAGAGTISRKEAEEDREKLMEERSKFVVEHNREVFEMEFFMCEH